MANTIPDFTDDQARIALINAKCKASGTTTLPDSQKFAVVTLGLAPAVTSADYAAMKTAIMEIDGIQGVDLLVDGQAAESSPAGYTQVLKVDAHRRFVAIPAE